MKRRLLLLINILLIASCSPNIQSKDVNDETRIQQNFKSSHENLQLDYDEQIYDDIIEESIQLQPEEYNAVTVESLIKDENKAMLPQIADDPNSQSTNANEQHSSPDVSEPEQPASPIANQTIETPVNETPPKLICPNGWYDENQPCTGFLIV